MWGAANATSLHLGCAALATTAPLTSGHKASLRYPANRLAPSTRLGTSCAQGRSPDLDLCTTLLDPNVGRHSNLWKSLDLCNAKVATGGGAPSRASLVPAIAGIHLRHAPQYCRRRAAGSILLQALEAIWPSCSDVNSLIVFSKIFKVFVCGDI
jgi:hypothetical protein